MGSFWKKMLRLSSARAKGLAHGADVNASEVRRDFGGPGSSLGDQGPRCEGVHVPGDQVASGVEGVTLI